MIQQLIFQIVISAFICNGQGMVNFALNKTANQSTTLSYMGFDWVAAKAVDGNHDDRDPVASKTCSATNNTAGNHIWRVDIGFQIIVKNITVYGKTDPNFGDDQLNGVELYLGNNSEPWIGGQRFSTTSVINKAYVFKPDNVVASVISLRRTRNILTICEVTVEGECLSNSFSASCNVTCGKCFLGKKCDTTTGMCPDGYCDPGWKGPLCNEECNPRKYGYNCSETCGHCFYGSSNCSKSDGHCTDGCVPGFQDDDCKKGCEAGKYGYDCKETCGNCFYDNRNCSTSNGLCPDGCKAGWMGDDCKKAFENVERTAVDVGLVGGSAGAAIAVVALIVAIIVIIVVKRRRKAPHSSIPTENDMSNKKDDVVVYENPSFVNIKARSEANADTRMTSQKEGKTKKLRNEDSETYYNVGRALQKGTIPLSRFWDYVQEKFLDYKYFSEEFEKLPTGPQLPITVALRPENRSKNRYKQLYPYDVNRVVLNPMSNDDSDYINASFIDGYSGPRVYIASQGTTKDNIDDFWRMIWQYDVEKVVMLTGLVEGGRHKCELYWPVEEGQSSVFGRVTVTLIDTDLFADYDMRTLEITVGNRSKRLTQFHYTTWPDKGVPKAAASIVQFWNSVNIIHTNGPILVHCSTGIGRTGTYIALDYLANQAKVEGHVNVLACVSNMRRQRVNLVQTKEQYIFLHEALVEALMLSGTATSSEKFPKVYNEYERLQNEVVSHENVYATIRMEDNDGEECDSKQDEFSAAKKV